jgi:hypothetical protein
MQRLTQLFTVLALVTNGIFAAGPDLNKAQAFAGNSANATHFLENKGQIKQTDGSPAPYVSHVLERGNTKIFLLKQGGIAYQFEQAHYPEEI